MTDRTHRNPVVNLEDFLSRLAEREKQDTVAITERCNWTTRSELRFDVLRRLAIASTQRYGSSIMPPFP